MDVRLLATLAAIALVTTGLFGLAPAIYASRRATADGLKEGGRLSTPPKVRRWTHALLVGQFAVTLALLNGAGLTARRFFNFYALDRNVQTSDALTTFIRLPAKTYATRDQRLAFHEQLKARLLAVPGVTASTVASAAPFSPAGRRQLTSVDGRPTSDPPPDVMTVVVEPAYFQTVVRGLVLGESFSELHGTPGHEAAIVNQRFAERLPRRRESDRSSPRASAADGPTDLPERSRRPCAAGVGGDRRRRSGHSTGPRRGPDGVSAVSCRGAGRGHVDRARLRRVGPASSRPSATPSTPSIPISRLAS